jgi:hypothetical protein
MSLTGRSTGSSRSLPPRSANTSAESPLQSARGNKTSARASNDKNPSSSRRPSKISATPRGGELEQSATFISQLLGAEGSSDEDDGQGLVISDHQGVPPQAGSLEDCSIFTEARDPRVPGEEEGHILQPPEEFASSLEQTVDETIDFTRAHASLSRVQTER